MKIDNRIALIIISLILGLFLLSDFILYGFGSGDIPYALSYLTIILVYFFIGIALIHNQDVFKKVSKVLIALAFIISIIIFTSNVISMYLWSGYLGTNFYSLSLPLLNFLMFVVSRSTK